MHWRSRHETYVSDLLYLRYDANSSLSQSQASDLKSTTRLVKEISQLTYNARNYELLNSGIQTLSKKHGQLKVAIQEMVEQAIGWLDEIKKRDGQEKWLQLIETLRTVTEGKVRSNDVLCCRLRGLIPVVFFNAAFLGDTKSTRHPPPLKIP